MAAAKALIWAITGASGQLGSELSRLLNSQGHQVRAFTHKELDISNTSSIGILKEQSPEILVNCAAWTAVDDAEQNSTQAFAINEVGAGNMARAARELDIPFIQISTDYVFSGEKRSPWKVSEPTAPTSIYGRSKLAGEELINEIYPKGSYILRTAWLYGANGRNFAKSIVKRVLTSDDQLKVVNDQFGQPTYSKDLAQRIIEIGQGEIPFGTYHATNSGATSWFEFAQSIVEHMGESVARVSPVQSAEFDSPVKRPSYSVLDHQEWFATKFEPLRDWKVALAEAMPSIITQVEEEIREPK